MVPYILFDGIKSMKIKGLHTAPGVLSSENQMAPDSTQPSALPGDCRPKGSVFNLGALNLTGLQQVIDDLLKFHGIVGKDPLDATV